MKLITFFSLSFLLIMGCNSKKIILEKNKLESLKATYEVYNSGIESGAQGYNLKFVLLSNHIILEEVYFKQKISKLKLVNDTLYTAFIQTKAFKEKKPIYEGDNNLAENEEDKEIEENIYTQFDTFLNAEEAIVKCILNTKTKYYKVKMTEKVSMIQPM